MSLWYVVAWNKKEVAHQGFFNSASKGTAKLSAAREWQCGSRYLLEARPATPDEEEDAHAGRIEVLDNAPVPLEEEVPSFGRIGNTSKGLTVRAPGHKSWRTGQKNGEYPPLKDGRK